ncbi:MAG: alpha/beta fold hydrolase [Halieaceae bacterium]
MLLHHVHRGEGPPVILLHGLFGSAANLGMVARGLATDFSVYSLDLPNHGQSPRSERMGYPDMAEAVAGFIHAQGLAPCHVLGHSMGGKVAMQLALQAPACIDKLVVADIAPVQYPPHHDHVLAGLEAVAAAAPAGRQLADAVLAEHVSEAGVRAFLLKSWQADDNGDYRWQINYQAVRGNYARLGEANVLTKGAQPFAGPALFIIGGESDYVQAQHREQTLALFPGAQVKVLEGAGHWLHAEKPALFNKQVLRFLLN